MTDREAFKSLATTLRRIRFGLGIRDDFCPLGIALELEPAIRSAIKLAEDHARD